MGTFQHASELLNMYMRLGHRGCLLFIFEPKAVHVRSPLTQLLVMLSTSLCLRSLKILHYTVLSSHLLEGMLQLHNRETACSILKQRDEGEGVWSHCWGAVTHRTCIITDFLSLSSCLSFPESCKWCAGQSLSRPTSRNRPLQQGLTPPRLGLSGAADAATKRYQFSFASVYLVGFEGNVVMRN